MPRKRTENNCEYLRVAACDDCNNCMSFIDVARVMLWRDYWQRHGYQP